MPASQANQNTFALAWISAQQDCIRRARAGRQGAAPPPHCHPRFDYDATVRAVSEAVQEIEKNSAAAPPWAWDPGTISTRTGFVKNANSTWLNGKPFDKDLGAL